MDSKNSLAGPNAIRKRGSRYIQSRAVRSGGDWIIQPRRWRPKATSNESEDRSTGMFGSVMHAIHVVVQEEKWILWLLHGRRRLMSGINDGG
jgi:hypothetical protein